MTWYEQGSSSSPDEGQVPPGQGQAPPTGQGQGPPPGQGPWQGPPPGQGPWQGPPPGQGPGQGPPPGQGPQWNAPGGPAWGGPYGLTPSAAIKTYRTQAIIILCCCIIFGILPLITGIPALIYSTRVTENITRGDYAAALTASRRARILCWVSLGVILLVVVIVIIIAAIASSGGGGVSTGNTGGVNT